MEDNMVKNILFCMLFFLFSCVNPSRSDELSVQYLDNSNIEERNYFKDDNASHLFISKYDLTNLENHELYRINSEININLYFPERFTFQEGKNALRYFSKITTYTGNRFSEPYEKEIIDIKKSDKVHFRIFINMNLLIYRSYDFGKNIFEYYENIIINADREYNGINKSQYIEYITRLNTPIESIEILNPFKGFVKYIKIYSSDALSDNDINKIKSVIENEIAPSFENQEKKYLI